MKKRNPKLSNFSFAIMVILLVAILYLINTKIQARKQERLILPSAGKGKIIDYFILSDSNREIIESSVLLNNKWSAVFIFKRPCAFCDYNINYWKKISRAFNKHGVQFYGIILENFDTSYQTLVDRKLGIQFYFPLDVNKFKEVFNVRFKLAQTVLLKRNKVLFSKAGEINVNDYFTIKRILKGD